MCGKGKVGHGIPGYAERRAGWWIGKGKLEDADAKEPLERSWEAAGDLASPVVGGVAFSREEAAAAAAAAAAATATAAAEAMGLVPLRWPWPLLRGDG